MIASLVLVCIMAAAVALYLGRNSLWPKKAASRAEGKSAAVSIASSALSSSVPSSGSAVVITNTSSLLMLVNKTHKLPESFQPQLTTIPAKYYSDSGIDSHFDSRAASYLENMVDDAGKTGIKIMIYSGYRSHSTQVANFDRHVNQSLSKGLTSSAAESAAAVSVAPPGTSEHETGLSCDLIVPGWYSSNSDLNENFDKTPAFTWLSANAANYGFILRYPKDKVDITQYEYEPWHYRFVGVDNAGKIKQSGLCLEEYLQKYPEK